MKIRTWVGALLALCLLGGSIAEAQAKRPRTSGSGRAAQQNARPAGEVSVVLTEGFMNSLLDAITSQSAPLKFPIASGGRDCASELILAPSTEGVKTRVNFASGQVGATVAFRGTYYTSLLGCVPFEGWADSNFNLAFDRERQAFVASVEIRDVSLKNVPALLTNTVKGMVQNAINQRINPITLLRTEQLAATLPLAQNSSLSLRAKGIRHAVAGKELRLYVAYEIVSGS